MIGRKARGNERLRQGMVYQQRKQGAGLYLLEEVRLVVEKLQQTIIDY
jgi:hypothetical protein